MRVLVVDDNSSAREITASIARGLGLRVDTAANGQAALACVAQAEQQGQAYDLVLIDWKMPEMDGIETLRLMHARRPTCPPASWSPPLAAKRRWTRRNARAWRSSPY
jgi:CheY-like chemotaxis protein